MTRHSLPWVAALALTAACSNDFDAFSFGDGDPVDEADGSIAGDAAPTGGDGGLSSSGEAGTPDDAAAGDAGALDGAIAGDAASDAQTTMDAAADASGSDGDDGGSVPDSGSDPAACLAAIAPVTPTGKDSCDDCACGACQDATEACVGTDNASDNALCAAVLACAFQNDCQGWDCYCAANSCGGGPNGDGPCVAEMNAAAGGRKAEVMVIWASTDNSEPLVRAMNAIDCTVGLHMRSPNGPSSGMCETECM